MDSKDIRNILSLYDSKGVFKHNKMYSRPDQIVFTRPDDKRHWISFHIVDQNRLYVTQTDQTGLITNRDHYQRDGDKIICTGKERMESSKAPSLRQKINDLQMHRENTVITGQNKIKSRGEPSL